MFLKTFSNQQLNYIQIDRNGDGVIIPLVPAGFDGADINGFVPIIINVSPVINLQMLLGLQTDQKVGPTPSKLL